MTGVNTAHADPVGAGTLGGWVCDHHGILDLVEHPDGTATLWGYVANEWTEIAHLSVTDRAVVGGVITPAHVARENT